MTQCPNAPNKHAVLIAMARQELDKVVEAIQSSLTQADVEGEGESSVTQRVVRALIRGFSGRQRLRGALIVAMISEGHFSELTTPIERVVEFLHRPDRGVAEENLSSLPPEQLYVLTFGRALRPRELGAHYGRQRWAGQGICAGARALWLQPAPRFTHPRKVEPLENGA